MSSKKPDAEALEKQQRASRELEQLTAAMKEVVQLLRSGMADENAYALAYDLRHRLGKVVTELGVSVGGGLPRHMIREWAKDTINEQLATEEEQPASS